MSGSDFADSVWEVPATLRRDLLALLCAGPARPAKMTYDEFLAWATEDTLAEWVDGEVVVTSPASRRHQELVSFFDRLLGAYAAVHDLGIILTAPFQMKLAHTGREPDVLLVAREHMDRLTETYLDGPADLVIEIMSPESTRRDRGDKFFEYAAGGIPEYWLIEPDRHHAAFFRLDAHGYYELAAAGTSGSFRSEALGGFELELEWLWRQPLPDPLSILLDIDAEAYSHYRLPGRQGDEP